MKWRVIWGCAIAIMCGCTSARLPLSSTLIKKYNLKPEDLQSLQVYVVSDYVGTPAVTIYEKLEYQKEKQAKKELVIKEEATSERYIIPQNTPCIITKVDAEDGGYISKLHIRCNPDDERALTFGLVKGDTRDYFFLYTIKKDNVVYTRLGEDMVPVSQTSSDAYLKIDMRKVKRVSRQTKVAKGIRMK